MIIIDSTLESVRSLLKQNVSDSLTEVRTAFQKNVVPNPIRKNYIVLNIADVLVTPQRDETGRKYNIIKTKLSVSIHCNEKADPKKLLRLFSEVITIFDESAVWGYEEAGCGGVESDADTNSLCLRGYIKVSSTG